MADSSSGQGVFDIDRIRRLVELMKEHELREIDLQQGDEKIRLCRAAPDFAPAAVPSFPSGTWQGASASGGLAAQAGGPTIAPSGDGPNVKTILSPMVGTFYARPNPNSEPYVKVGDHVEPSTTVCIIEAMKTFNEIQAELRGKILAVLVEDGEHVDTDKPLFKVDTSK